jgi:hypothetical protein
MVTMTTYTSADVKRALMALAPEANRAGALGADEVIIYSAGSKLNGVAPEVLVRGADGIHSHAPFLPRFTHKSTARELVYSIDAARLAFNTVNNLKAGK